MKAINEFFANGEFWAIFIKVLLTVLFTTGIGVLGTLIGKIIASHKNSKIYKYAKACVEAAEIKFPNEGKKMGPEKMQYVMDQMMIKFPKIRDNQYLYNIAEAAVYELNKQMQQEAAIKEFEKKYGEKPLAVKDKEFNNNLNENEISNEDIVEDSTSKQENSAQSQISQQKKYNKIQSF